MEKLSDIVIVSAFGRGSWLASQLAARGLSVELMDLSSQLGKYDSSELDGPIGVFGMDKFLDHQKERLLEDAPYTKVKEGFTVWLDDGPIEMGSLQGLHRLKEKGISNDVIDFLKNESLSDSKANTASLKFFSEQPFKETWLLGLSRLARVNSSLDTSTFSSRKEILSLFSEYGFRRTSHDTLKKSFEKTKERGIQTLSSSRVLDISIHSKVFEGIEVSGEKSGLIRGSQLIWALTSEETKKLSVKVFETLFAKNSVEADWYWAAFNLRSQETLETRIIPERFLILENLYLPWTHENLVFVERWSDREFFKMWVKIPTSQRFQKGYLEALGTSLCDLMQNRIRGSHWSVERFPLEFTCGYDELGPPLWPLYNSLALKLLSPKKFKNVIFDGPEQWATMDWSGRFAHQYEIYGDVLSWWTEKMNKGKTRDQEVHAP